MSEKTTEMLKDAKVQSKTDPHKYVSVNGKFFQQRTVVRGLHLLLAFERHLPMSAVEKFHYTKKTPQWSDLNGYSIYMGRYWAQQAAIGVVDSLLVQDPEMHAEFHKWLKDTGNDHKYE